MRYIIETENQEVIEHVMVWAKYQRARVMFDDGIGQTCHKSEDEIAQAIELLLKEFAVKSQWVAVYRVLVDYYEFPSAFSAFCQRIQEIMPHCHSPFACDYQAIQKGISSGILAKPYEKWKEYKPQKNDKIFLRQKRTAERFLELLGSHYRKL